MPGVGSGNVRGRIGRCRTPAAAARGLYCSACGGHCGPHITHHDQAAHDRARRRYDGLHAKAEQVCAKYGL